MLIQRVLALRESLDKVRSVLSYAEDEVPRHLKQCFLVRAHADASCRGYTQQALPVSR